MANHEKSVSDPLSDWVVKYIEVRYGTLKPSLKKIPLYKLTKLVELKTCLNFNPEWVSEYKMFLIVSTGYNNASRAVYADKKVTYLF